MGLRVATAARRRRIFQVALQYGAGVKVHLSPHVLVRADVRETLSKQPDFWTKSYPDFSGVSEADPTFAPGTLDLNGPLRHRLLSFGIAVAF